MDLKKERENLIAQRDNAFAVYHQTIGAISLIDALLAESPEVVAEMKEEDFLKSISEG